MSWMIITMVFFVSPKMNDCTLLVMEKKDDIVMRNRIIGYINGLVPFFGETTLSIMKDFVNFLKNDEDAIYSLFVKDDDGNIEKFVFIIYKFREDDFSFDRTTSQLVYGSKRVIEDFLLFLDKYQARIENLKRERDEIYAEYMERMEKRGVFTRMGKIT